MLKKLTESVTKSWQTVTIIIAVAMVGYNMAGQQAATTNIISELTVKVAELSDSIKEINQIDQRVSVLEGTYLQLSEAHLKDVVEVSKYLILASHENGLPMLNEPVSKAILKQTCNIGAYKNALIEQIGISDTNTACNYINK